MFPLIFFTGRFELLMSFLRILQNQHYRENHSLKVEAEENKPEKLFLYMYINN